VQDDCEQIEDLPAITASCSTPFSPTCFPLLDFGQ
jgi:hypothetical protein